jgi:hypothetical protein
MRNASRPATAIINVLLMTDLFASADSQRVHSTSRLERVAPRVTSLLATAVLTTLWTMVLSVTALLPLSVSAQSTPVADAALGTVRITAAVRAGGKPLPTGSYELRLSSERPAPNRGQGADSQRYVDFVANGVVVGRDVAEVLRDADLPPTGASTQPVADGVRVELLRGGEFLRISVRRTGVRYLIHLPIAP